MGLGLGVGHALRRRAVQGRKHVAVLSLSVVPDPFFENVDEDKRILFLRFSVGDAVSPVAMSSIRHLTIPSAGWFLSVRTRGQTGRACFLELYEVAVALARHIVVAASTP